MIYCLSGTPGVGKSLYMVSKLIPEYLKIRSVDGCLQPCHIYTNIIGLKPWVILALQGLPESVEMYFHRIGEVPNPETGELEYDKLYAQYFYLKPESIEWLEGVDPKTRKAYKYPNFEKAEYLPPNSLIILDEAQNIFDSTCFGERFSQDIKPYLSLHRHIGHNIFWASQDEELVYIGFRRLTEQVWLLEKLDNFKLFGGSESFKVSQYEGKYSGNKLMVEPYAVKQVKKDHRYYAAYKSHDNELVREKKHTTNMFMNSKGLRIVAILILICIVVVAIKGNPIGIIAQKNGATMNRHAAAAQTPPRTGLAPTGGAQGEKKEVQAERQDSIICVQNTYTHAGVDYVIINGISQPKDKAVKYGKCVENR